MSFEKNLIKAVRKNEVLYNIQHPDYRRLNIKDTVWQKIAEELGSTQDQCKNAWRSLRDIFIKITRRERRRPPGTIQIGPKRKWVFYEDMSFLDDSSKSNENADNVISECEEVKKNTSASTTTTSDIDMSDPPEKRNRQEKQKNDSLFSDEFLKPNRQGKKQKDDGLRHEFPKRQGKQKADGLLHHDLQKQNQQGKQKDDDDLHHEFKIFLQHIRISIEEADVEYAYENKDKSSTMKLLEELARNIDEANLPDNRLNEIHKTIAKLVFDLIY